MDTRKGVFALKKEEENTWREKFLSLFYWLLLRLSVRPVMEAASQAHIEKHCRGGRQR